FASRRGQMRKPARETAGLIVVSSRVQQRRYPMTLHMPRLKQQAQIRRLPDQITINYGPREQLGRFFLAADKAARDRGVTLSLSTDFDYLRQINAANRRSWDSLAPSFNNEVSDIGEHNGFCLIG